MMTSTYARSRSFAAASKPSSSRNVSEARSVRPGRTLEQPLPLGPVLPDVALDLGSRPDDAHVASQHAPELRQLVELRPPKQRADAGDPRIARGGDRRTVRPASTTIVRSFGIWIGRPPRPTRVCTNNAGPRESSFTADREDESAGRGDDERRACKRHVEQALPVRHAHSSISRSQRGSTLRPVAARGERVRAARQPVRERRIARICSTAAVIAAGSSRWHEQRRLAVVKQKRDAADRGADHAQPGRHRLEHRERRVIDVRRVEEHVGGGEMRRDLALGNPSDELEPVANAELGGALLDARAAIRPCRGRSSPAARPDASPRSARAPRPRAPGCRSHATRAPRRGAARARSRVANR